MRLVGPAVGALAVAVVLAGCGSAGSQEGETITVNLPSYTPASSGVGHVVSPARRLGAYGSGSGRGAVQATPAPEIAPLTPRANARLNGVSEWIPYWALSEAVPNAIENANVIKVAHPFIYQITGTSTIDDQSGGQAPAVSRELAAAHIDVIPTVTETDDMAEFASVLTHEKKQAALLSSLESIADQPANDGIDLDFENLAYGSGNAKQAEQVATLYPELVGKLCAALHQTNRSCEVTVFAKDSAGNADADGLSTYVYDYSALAAVADRLQLMAYDDHGPTSGSGPIAPLPWVQSVLRYALTQIPADKLVLGVPAYGYDWSSNASGASPVTAASAAQLARQENSPIEWDAQDEEPYFSYTTTSTTVKRTPYTTTKRTTHTKVVTGSAPGTATTAGIGPSTLPTRTETVTVTTRTRHIRTTRTVHHVGHVVWFEDSTANYDRAVLAADDHLAGIAIWAGGDESPGLWSMLGRLSR